MLKYDFFFIESIYSLTELIIKNREEIIIKFEMKLQLLKKKKIRKFMTQDRTIIKKRDLKSLYFCLIQFILGPIAIRNKKGIIIGAITAL